MLRIVLFVNLKNEKSRVNKSNYNVLTALSFKKIENYFALLRTFQNAKKGKFPLNNKTFPIAISFEPTTRCNLHCPECPSGLRAFSRPTGDASFDFFKSTIDQINEHLIWLTLYFQGEPLLNSTFYEMVEYARKKKIFVATSTNGHFLTQKNCEKLISCGLNKLIISLDGIDQNSYSKYRKGGDFETVINGIKRLVSEKRKSKNNELEIIIQFLVFRSNEQYINEIKKLGKTLGVDKVELKTAQFYNYEKGHPEIPKNSKWARYKEIKPGEWTTKKPMKNYCWRTWSSAVITWDGLMVPCCFDKDADHQFGDLKKEKFEDIWKGEKRKTFLKKIASNRKSIAICRNCTE